jgi:3-hydroxyacyl-[acyl-carrier-protein] dehydratase
MNEILQGIAAASLGAATTDETGTVEARYLFPASFAGFSGHFPDYPILPAVVQILAAVALVGEGAGRRQRLVAVEDAKFLNPVRPDQELTVRCRTRSVKGKLLHDAQLSVGEATASSLLLQLADYEELP